MFDYTGFGALIRRKRGELGLSQQQLAVEIFDDENRKGDISRIENARTKPIERTINRLCEHLEITEAEMEPIRQSRPLIRATRSYPHPQPSRIGGPLEPVRDRKPL